MLSIKRGRHGGAGAQDAPRRRGTPLVVSLGINAVIMAAFFRAVTMGYHWNAIFPDEKAEETRAERIGFVRLSRPSEPAHPEQSGGDGQPVTGTPSRTPRLRAPTVIPSTIPAPAAAPTPADPGGSGEIIGGGGPEQGIRPSYSDPRLWVRPGMAAAAGPRGARELAKTGVDSVIAEVLGARRDSLLAAQEAAAGQRKPGDWTFKGPGGTWGMDQNNIHLGKIKVPSAVLALLSSNLQRSLGGGNPMVAENDRRLAAARADIAIHANREMNEDDFRSAVRAIRARKDKERAERIAERRRAAELAGTEDGGSSAGASAPR